MLLEETRIFRRPSWADMREVRRLAFSELDRFLFAAGSPPGKYARYEERLIAVCLAQGAAQHLVDLEVTDVYDNEVSVDEAEIWKKDFGCGLTAAS